MASLSGITRLLLCISFYSNVLCIGSYDIPKPTGPYSVGSLSLHMIDSNRFDPYEPESKRELMVQVWYPALAQQDLEKSMYATELVSYTKESIAKNSYIPKGAIDWFFPKIRSHATDNLPVLMHEHKYPVIIFSHGLSSLMDLHTVHAQNLASHGYVVFGINHTFNCGITVFPNGKKCVSQYNYETSNKKEEWQKIVALWQADVDFVVTQIVKSAAEKGDGSTVFDYLDVEKIGMIGHSMGGATTTQMLRNDPRILAGINMDGPLFGQNYNVGFRKPYMAFIAQGSLASTFKPITEARLKAKGMTREDAEYIRDIFAGIKRLCLNIRTKFETDAYYILFEDTEHKTFTDAPLVKDVCMPLGNWFQSKFSLGTVEPRFTLSEQNRFIVSFFDKYLKKKESALLTSVYDLCVSKVTKID